MAPDDVHDLFDTGRADESDAPADEPDGSAERGVFPPLSDDEPAGPADRAGGETARSTQRAPEQSVEDDDGGFEMAVEDDGGGSGTAVSGTTSGGGGDDSDGFELGGSTGAPPDDDGSRVDESTTSSPGSFEDDTEAGEAAPGGPDETGADETDPSREAAPGGPDETDADETDPSREAVPGGSESAAADEMQSTAPTTPAEEATGARDAAPESAATSPSSGGAVRDEAAGPTPDASASSSPDGGASTASSPDGGVSTAPSAGSVGPDDADGAQPTGPADPSEDETAEAGSASADPGESASAGASTSADGASAARDEQRTASPEEPGQAPSGTAGDRGDAAGGGSNRLPLGIDELDRAMGGGVPPGRLVVLVADPGVQSELIVDSVLAQRDTLFVTTDRPDWEVQKDIEPGLGTGEVVIRDHSPDSLLSGLDSLLEELGTSSNFVLDSVNELELVPRNRYRVFLSDVKRRLFDTGSIGLLTGVTVGHESARDLTLRRADIVLRLETRTSDRELRNLLSVPKFRGGAAIKETFKLELTDDVRVDTSWNDR